MRLFLTLRQVLIGIFVVIAFLFVGDVILPLVGQHPPVGTPGYKP